MVDGGRCFERRHVADVAVPFSVKHPVTKSELLRNNYLSRDKGRSCRVQCERSRSASERINPCVCGNLVTGTWEMQYFTAYGIHQMVSVYKEWVKLAD